MDGTTCRLVASSEGTLEFSILQMLLLENNGSDNSDF